MKTTITILIIALLVLLVITGVMTFLLFNNLFMRRCVFVHNGFGMGTAYEDEIMEGCQWLRHSETHEVEIRSGEGLRLVGHLIARPDAKRTVLMFHGWRGGWDHDFAAIGRWLFEQGSNLLLVEQRGQGSSEGKYMTMGLKERYDVRLWLNWVKEQVDPGHPVYLYGISMGAASVLMASGKLEEGEANGLIADCGFSHPGEEVKYCLKRSRILEHPFMDLLTLAGKLFVHVDLRQGSVVRALGVNEIPVLFFHGENDNFVPIAMTEQNAKACKAPHTVVRIREAGHGMSALVNRRMYREKMTAFFRENDKR